MNSLPVSDPPLFPTPAFLPPKLIHLPPSLPPSFLSLPPSLPHQNDGDDDTDYEDMPPRPSVSVPNTKDFYAISPTEIICLPNVWGCIYVRVHVLRL